MTPKERWLAAIHMQPVDRLPFWPKLDGAYPKAQAAPFREMGLGTIHDWIGSDKHTGIAGCIRETYKRTTVEHTQDNTISRTVFRTPSRELHLVREFDEPSHSWHPTEFPVRTLEDIQAMREWYEDITVEFSPDGLEKAKIQSEQIGQDALTVNDIGHSPLMYWVEWLAGVENAHFLLMDHQEEVEALFEAMHSVLMAKTRILCEHSPADLFYLVENTSTTLISPDQYGRYCACHMPHHRGIVVTSAGVMPPLCKPETIKQVCEWVKQYPARM